MRVHAVEHECQVQYLYTWVPAPSCNTVSQPMLSCPFRLFRVLVPRLTEAVRESKERIFVREGREAMSVPFDDKRPSRVLDHLFIGGRAHAKNRGMLKELGINRILNVTPPKTCVISLFCGGGRNTSTKWLSEYIF